MDQHIYDLIIIGAGPAGLVSGLYAGRYRLDTLLFEKLSVGGQIMLSPNIENFPGFPGGITTDELIGRFKKQAEEVGVKIEAEEIIELTSEFNNKAPLHLVKTSDNLYRARSIIIASGAEAKRLGIGGEERLTGRGVSYCATCDGPLFRNKEVIVIGGGDKAIEEAILLSAYASKVTLIHRRSLLRAAKILEEKAKTNNKISFVLETVLEEVIGKDRVEAVKLKNLKTATLSELSCQGVFIFVGIQPNTAFIKNQIQKDEGGFIITEGNLATSVKGIFACGDCIKKSLYQVVNACGEGATAASSAQGYLLSL
jgi:thioredoxin reductase (NADPH)